MSPCPDWLTVRNFIFCQVVPQSAADFAVSSRGRLELHVRVFEELCVFIPLLHQGFWVTLLYGLAWGTDLLCGKPSPWALKHLFRKTSPIPVGQSQVRQKSPTAELGPAHRSYCTKTFPRGARDALVKHSCESPLVSFKAGKSQVSAQVHLCGETPRAIT